MDRCYEANMAKAERSCEKCGCNKEERDRANKRVLCHWNSWDINFVGKDPLAKVLGQNCKHYAEYVEPDLSGTVMGLGESDFDKALEKYVSSKDYHDPGFVAGWDARGKVAAKQRVQDAVRCRKAGRKAERERVIGEVIAKWDSLGIDLIDQDKFERFLRKLKEVRDE